MAQDQLSLYNEALTHLGQRELSSLTEDREPRHRLDSAYSRSAVEHCLELVKPNFASKVAVIAGTAAITFDYSHAKPTDYVVLMDDPGDGAAVYSDTKMDQQVNRYLITNDAILTDYASITIHYVSNNLATTLTSWTPSFFKVVAAYLALEVAPRISPDRVEDIEKKFGQFVAEAVRIEIEKRPMRRSSEPSVTLTEPWRKIYNDALLIMGLDEINTAADDSNRRAKLDRAKNARLVESALEEVGWSFGRVSTKIFYDPSLEPSWGYTYVFEKPIDMHRLHGLFQDEYMNTPLKRYKDEGEFWFCDLAEIFVEYVSTDWLTDPSAWPAHFARMVAGCLARDAAPSLKIEGADPERAYAVCEERIDTARNTDAMQSPPQMIHAGNWVRSRMVSRSGYRGRG